MAKILTVYDCGDCRHYGNFTDGEVDYAFCHLVKRGYSPLEDVGIPEWCPLPDVKVEG